jgi:hypothetical protein
VSRAVRDFAQGRLTTASGLETQVGGLRGLLNRNR